MYSRVFIDPEVFLSYEEKAKEPVYRDALINLLRKIIDVGIVLIGDEKNEEELKSSLLWLTSIHPQGKELHKQFADTFQSVVTSERIESFRRLVKESKKYDLIMSNIRNLEAEGAVFSSEQIGEVLGIIEEDSKERRLEVIGGSFSQIIHKVSEYSKTFKVYEMYLGKELEQEQFQALEHAFNVINLDKKGTEINVRKCNGKLFMKMDPPSGELAHNQGLIINENLYIVEYRSSRSSEWIVNCKHHQDDFEGEKIDLEKSVDYALNLDLHFVTRFTFGIRQILLEIKKIVKQKEIYIDIFTLAPSRFDSIKESIQECFNAKIKKYFEDKFSDNKSRFQIKIYFLRDKPGKKIFRERYFEADRCVISWHGTDIFNFVATNPQQRESLFNKAFKQLASTKYDHACFCLDNFNKVNNHLNKKGEVQVEYSYDTLRPARQQIGDAIANIQQLDRESYI